MLKVNMYVPEYQAIFFLTADKALGTDGFSLAFFKKCWEIIKEDLMKALEESHGHGNICRNEPHVISLILEKERN